MTEENDDLPMKEYNLSAGDRVMDTLIEQTATVTKVIKSAVLPDWTVAYMVTYDEAPAMEYNLGHRDCMQLSKYVEPLHLHQT
jgi:hypothetical protein